MRVRRNGTTDTVMKRKPVLIHSNGYRVIYEKGHPLADKNGYVYEHRYVFHAEHGDGRFRCHVCAAALDWDTMHVDHLNDVPDDNRLENLAPACPTCNTWRGRHKMITTHRQRARRLIVDGEALTIAEWAAIRGIPLTTLRRRLADGWDVRSAVMTPSGPTGPKRKAA